MTALAIIKKLLKVVGLSLAGILAALILLLTGLFLYGNIGIPEGVEVSYVQGVWEPATPFVFLVDMDRLKADGINTISMGPFSFNRILDFLYKPIIAAIVKCAHQKGLAVHLAPVSWGPGFDARDPHLEMEPWLTEVAIEWAKFAEKFNVEFYSPQNEPDVVLGVEKTNTWAPEVLTEIEKYYHGTTILKLGMTMTDPAIGEPYQYQVSLPYWGDEDAEYQGFLYYPDSSGWDYLMIDIFPADELSHFETFPENLSRFLDTAIDWAEEKGNEGVMVGEFAYPRSKPATFGIASIMPGPEVSPEEQAQRTGEYLDAAMPKVDGIIYCGWVLSGYGMKGYPVEETIKEKFLNFTPSL